MTWLLLLALPAFSQSTGTVTGKRMSDTEVTVKSLTSGRPNLTARPNYLNGQQISGTLSISSTTNINGTVTVSSAAILNNSVTMTSSITINSIGVTSGTYTRNQIYGNTIINSGAIFDAAGTGAGVQAIHWSINIASVTRLAVGKFQANFVTNYSSSITYVCSGMCDDTVTNNGVLGGAQGNNGGAGTYTGHTMPINCMNGGGTVGAFTTGKFMCIGN